MAVRVAASSTTPAAVHFSWVSAQAKYARNSGPHFGSFVSDWHCWTSLSVGGGSLTHLPFEEQEPEPEPEQASATTPSANSASRSDVTTRTQQNPRGSF